jgi:hypothetical protein
MFLAELMRLEGRGIYTNGRCELCPQDGAYRCLDCHAVQFLYADCLSRIHCFNPLHRLEVGLLFSSIVLPGSDTLGT